MALPQDTWMEIIRGSGPGTWKLAKALFRESGEPDQVHWCEFTIRELGLRKNHKFMVVVKDVHRLVPYKFEFMIRGPIKQLDGQDWEPLGKRFMVHYNPETRMGLFRILGDGDSPSGREGEA